jgi:intergrase/recombinase
VSEKLPTYNAIRLAARKRGVKCDMAFCRKIHTSHLRQAGIESEIVDLLQRSVQKSVFAKHYFTSGLDYSDKVLISLNKLKQQINTQ